MCLHSIVGRMYFISFGELCLTLITSVRYGWYLRNHLTRSPSSVLTFGTHSIVTRVAFHQETSIRLSIHWELAVGKSNSLRTRQSETAGLGRKCKNGLQQTLDGGHDTPETMMLIECLDKNYVLYFNKSLRWLNLHRYWAPPSPRLPPSRRTRCGRGHLVCFFLFSFLSHLCGFSFFVLCRVQSISLFVRESTLVQNLLNAGHGFSALSYRVNNLLWLELD